MSVIVITGVSSGLGLQIARLMNNGRKNYIIGLVEESETEIGHNCFCNRLIQCDLADEHSIVHACNLIKTYCQQLNILINCAGINEIDWLQDLRVADWTRVMNVNTRAIYLLAQELLPQLISAEGTILNIISNASHMPMTASLAYNASKAAAHIMTLQLARELTKLHNITVFGISPNKMAGTKMSKYIESRVPEVRGWTAEQAKAYQSAALLAGETDPVVLAEFITFLLQTKRNHQYLTGCVIPYGA